MRSPSLMHETLKKCGDDLTRENLMKQAANFQKFRLPLLLPGITVSTSPTDYYPIQAVQLRASRARPGSCSATSCTPKAPDLHWPHDGRKAAVLAAFSRCATFAPFQAAA